MSVSKQILIGFTLLFLLASQGDAGRLDLDVSIPEGSPLDFFSRPNIRRPDPLPIPTHKTPPNRQDVATGTNASESDDDSAGGTEVDAPGRTQPKKKKKGIPKRAADFSRIKIPLTTDFKNHLGWNSNVDMRGFKPKNPWKDAEQPKPQYPPPVTDKLNLHCVAFYLMGLLHPAQVSPREVTCYLVEVGRPAEIAAGTTANEPGIRGVTGAVRQAVGGIPEKEPTGPFDSKLEETLVRELSHRFAYDDRFGAWFLKRPPRKIFPILIHLAEESDHILVRRNATFALRAFNFEECVSPLRRLLLDADPVIRNRALTALLRWRDPSIVPWLIEQIGGDDVAFQSYAVYALGKIGDSRAIQPLFRALQARKADWEFVWAAVPALGFLEPQQQDIRDLLFSIFKDLDILDDPKPHPQMDRVDAAGTRRRILQQRILLALSLMGEEKRWPIVAERRPFRPNVLIQKETMRRIKAIKKARRKKQINDFADRISKKSKPKNPKPDPPATPVKAKLDPPPRKTGIALAVQELKESKEMYGGIRDVVLHGEHIAIIAETKLDVETLQVLLGSDWKGYPLAYRIGDRR